MREELVIMETCLESLWELIRDPISDVISKETFLNGELLKEEELFKYRNQKIKSCKKNIKNFFSELYSCSYIEEKEQIQIPEHVRILKESLDNFENSSVNGIQEAAKKAIDKSEKCGLCAVCKKCSYRFYKSIIENTSFREKSLPYELEDYFLKESQMHHYNVRMKSIGEHVDLKNKVLCLKGFSSSTPTIHSLAFESECSGGGLYVNYKGIGIVIDPGLEFLNSMHKQGIYINDIDVVFITHDHLDHNADSEQISSLLYDYNKYIVKKHKIAETVFNVNRKENHSIKWIVDDSTGRKLEDKIGEYTHLSDEITTEHEISVKGLKFKYSVIRTQHIKGSNDTYGIKLIFPYGDEYSLGYTSDTSFFPELSEFFSGVNMLIFNVSDIYKKDVKGVQDKHSHLGYNGSLKLLKATNPSLAIASEFCCTNGDFRMNFINTITTELKKNKNIKVIPGEIGLTVSLPENKLKCSICGKATSVEQMKILKPETEFGKFKFLCGHCIKEVI